MLGTALKFSLTLGISYIVLSFQFNDKYLFDHITDLTGPVGENIQQSLSTAFQSTWNKSKEYSSKLFTNSAPVIEKKYESAKNSISKNIQPTIKKQKKKIKEEFLEDLKKEEMSHLDSIIDEQ